MAVSGPAGSGRVFGLTRDASVLFYEADVDGSRALGFDEFLTILPKQMRSTATPEELRSLFNSADSNGNGVITLDELFLFTLAFAAEHTGTGFEAIFRRFDTNGEGRLDAREFARAAEDMGFGSIAHDLFVELDHDASGSISYDELLTFLKSRARFQQPGASANAKRFLTGMALHGPGSGALNPSKWQIHAASPEEFRTELKRVMAEQGCRISDLFRLMSPEGGALRRKDMERALIRIGHVMPAGSAAAYVVSELFETLDAGTRVAALHLATAYTLLTTTRPPSPTATHDLLVPPSATRRRLGSLRTQ